MTNYEGRESDLKNRINRHLSKLTKVDFDYYSAFNHSDILELKTVLGDINNLLTFKTTIEAMNWLSHFFNMDESSRTRNMSKIDGTKPNSKGYDIEINEPCPVIAEVKCTVPVNEGGKFGAAQHDSILKDIKNLIKGKGKYKDTSTFYKFIFIIDLGERTDQAVSDLLRITSGSSALANEFNDLKRNHMCQLKDRDKATDLDIRKVYLKKISFET